MECINADLVEKSMGAELTYLCRVKRHGISSEMLLFACSETPTENSDYNSFLRQGLAGLKYSIQIWGGYSTTFLPR